MQYNEIQGTDSFGEEHKAKFSHELIGGAAAFEAAKASPSDLPFRLRLTRIAQAYEDHVAKNGRPDEHARAKEVAVRRPWASASDSD